jgi:hypothetical protein
MANYGNANEYSQLNGHNGIFAQQIRTYGMFGVISWIIYKKDSMLILLYNSRQGG